MIKSIMYIFSLGGLLFLIGCSSTVDTEQDSNLDLGTTVNAYPILVDENKDDAETIKSNDAYPIDVTVEAFSEPRFSISKPIDGDSTVRVTAPPNLNLAIVDVTFNGSILGTGVSDGNGVGIINVQPLTQGHRIGLALTEPELGQSLDDMAKQYYSHRGDGFMNLPNVGVFFETTIVE